MRGRGGNRKGQNPLTRVYESNGPDVKIRGTASHVAEKYMQLARDAQSSGDPVSAENYYQHAEHYLRLIAAVQEQFRQNNPHYRENEGREGNFDESEDDGIEQGSGGEPYMPREQSYQGREQQPYPQREHQREQREPREQRPPPRERDQNYQPRHQPQAQPQPQPAQPNAAAPDGDIERLPAFVTGGVPQPAAANGAHGPNGFEGAPDRFPLHRRRRRRHPPRDGAPQGDAGGEPRQPSE